VVDVALKSYFITSASEHKLPNPDEFQEVISGLKFRKDPGPNGIPNRALKHLSQRAVSPGRIFNATVHTHHIPTA
jgi:hypothetical protein